MRQSKLLGFMNHLCSANCRLKQTNANNKILVIHTIRNNFSACGMEYQSIYY